VTWKPGEHRDLGDDPSIRLANFTATAAGKEATDQGVDLFAVIVTVVLSDGRAVTTCEPEMPKATVAEVLRQTRESIMESDPDA
jgi:hypothetical protein